MNRDDVAYMLARHHAAVTRVSVFQQSLDAALEEQRRVEYEFLLNVLDNYGREGIPKEHARRVHEWFTPTEPDVYHIDSVVVHHVWMRLSLKGVELPFNIKNIDVVLKYLGTRWQKASTMALSFMATQINKHTPPPEGTPFGALNFFHIAPGEIGLGTKTGFISATGVLETVQMIED